MKSMKYVVTLLAIAIFWSSCEKETALEKAVEWDVSGITPTEYTAKISPYETANYQVYVIEEGDGRHPLHNQTACFEINMFLESGEAVYTTIDADPRCFAVGSSTMPILGLEYGILNMSYGAKYRFVFPSTLAYGDSYASTGMATVPPQSTIYVDIELTSKH